MQKQPYPVSFTTPIRWGEMDALGHVNNVRYFEYFQDARIVLFEKLGYSTISMLDEGGPILAHTGCQFLRQITFPDTITVGAWVEKIGTTSLHIHYEIFSEALGAVAAQGTSVVVMVNFKTGEKLPIPEEMKQKLEHFARSR